MNDQARSRFSFGQRLALAIVPRMVWALLHLVGRTWRFEVIAEPGVIPILSGQKAGPEIYCFWHQCVLPCAFYFRGSGAVILISRSFDGELITRTLELFGFDAVRGSSSRGGDEGFRRLHGAVESGLTAIFTADGPRGPIYQTKMGPIKLARATGAPIGAFHLQPERAWILGSWDRFLIPKPFTRICVSWASWTRISGDDAHPDLESRRRDLNAAIERARLRSLDHFGKTAP